jgi:UDP-glucose 4-epimerase
MRGLVDEDVGVEHQPPREGDVRHSLADISLAENALGYRPSVEIERGLKEYIAWASKEMA